MNTSALFRHIVPLIAVTTLASAQGRDPDFWWTSETPRVVVFHKAWGYVSVLPGIGLYRSSFLAESVQDMSASDWARITAMPKAAMLGNGTMIVGGGTMARETSGGMYRYAPGQDRRFLTHSDLDGLNIGGGLEDDNVFDAFEPDGFAVNGTFSTDAGLSWYRAPRVDSFVEGVFLNRFPDLGFTTFSERDTAWYVLDMPARRWQPTNRIPRVCREITHLRNGSTVAITQTRSDTYTGIATKTAHDSAWIFHAHVRLRNANDSLVPIRRPRQGLSAVVRPVNDSTAVMALDGGVLVFSNGADVWGVKMEIPKTLVTVGLVSDALNVVDGVVYLWYNDRNGSQPVTIAYDMVSGVTRVLSRLPKLQRVGDKILVYGNGLRTYEPAGDVQRPALSARTDDGAMVYPIRFSSIVSHDSSLYTVGIFRGTEGNTLMLRNERAQWPTWLPSTSLTRLVGTFEIGVQPCVSTLAGMMSVSPRGLSRVQERARVQLRSDSISFVVAADPGKMMCGYRRLWQSRDSGATWQSVPAPYDSSEIRPVASSCLWFSDTLVIGFRGYSRQLDGEPNGSVPGGIFRSVDGGFTWYPVTLPVSAGWIESLHKTSSGDLWCWAIDRYLDVSGTDRTFRHNSATLLRSTDHGITWQIIRSEIRAQELSTLDTWSISSRDRRVLVNTNLDVRVSEDRGATWNTFTDLPFGTIVTGSTYDHNGNAWASTSIGLYRLNAPTSIVPGERCCRTLIDPVIAPNPTTGTVEVVWPATSDIQDVRLDVIDHLGRVVASEREGNTIRLLQPAAGVYFIRWQQGSSAGGTSIVVSK